MKLTFIVLEEKQIIVVTDTKFPQALHDLQNKTELNSINLFISKHSRDLCKQSRTIRHQIQSDDILVFPPRVPEDSGLIRDSHYEAPTCLLV